MCAATAMMIAAPMMSATRTFIRYGPSNAEEHRLQGNLTNLLHGYLPSVHAQNAGGRRVIPPLLDYHDQRLWLGERLWPIAANSDQIFVQLEGKRVAIRRC